MTMGTSISEFLSSPQKALGPLLRDSGDLPLARLDAFLLRFLLGSHLVRVAVVVRV
jgi:hypothetical protein